MSEELKFFILLLEKYAYDHNRWTKDVLQEWDDKGISQEIYDGYWQYHQESLENAYLDIQSLMETGKHYHVMNDLGEGLKVAEPVVTYDEKG